MAITIDAVTATGASGTTTRTRKFAVKVNQGGVILRQVQAVPSASKWSVAWAVLPAGSYMVSAGTTASKALTVAAPPPNRLYPTSPFWDLVPASPMLDPNSDAISKNFLGQGQWGNIVIGTELTMADWTRPYYEASVSDPTVTVHGGLGGSWTDPSCEGDVIHVPQGARPAGGSHWQVLDGGVVIRQPDNMIYSAWRSEDPVSGRAYQWAKIDANYSGVARDHGTGIGQAQLGPRQGQITYEELVEAKEIPHALFCEVRNWHSRRWPGWYPDDGKIRGGQVSDPTAPPMSGHFYLAYSSSEIDALAIPEYRKTIVRALAKYGWYTYDNGNSAHALLGESDIPLIVQGKPARWYEWAKVNLPGHFDSTAGKTIYSMDFQTGIDWTRTKLLAR